MDFVGNLSLFAAAKKFTNRSRTDKLTAMVRLAQFYLTHSVFWLTSLDARYSAMVILYVCSSN